MSLVGSRDVGLTGNCANSSSLIPNLLLTCSRLAAAKPKIFGTLTLTRPPAALLALAVMSLLFRPTRISLLRVMLPPSAAPASVVIRLLRRNWISRDRKLILAPIPDTVVPSMVALVLRAIESATTLMLPAAPVPQPWPLTAAPPPPLHR